MNVVRLVIPYPPLTGNHQHGRARNGRTYLLPEVKTWREQVAWEAKRYGVAGVIPARTKLRAEYLCFPPPDARADGGNLEKVISDALQHADVVKNDYWIKRCTWEVFDNSPMPRIEVEISPR